MEYKINSDLKFGDKVYVCELFHQEEDGGFVTDPRVFEELVEVITFREDGSVSYSTDPSDPSFKTVEEAKKFCEQALYEDGLQCCAIEDCLFQWEEGSRKEVVNFDTGEEVELKIWHLVTITEELK